MLDIMIDPPPATNSFNANDPLAHPVREGAFIERSSRQGQRSFDRVDLSRLQTPFVHRKEESVREKRCARPWRQEGL